MHPKDTDEMANSDLDKTAALRSSLYGICSVARLVCHST